MLNAGDMIDATFDHGDVTSRLASAEGFHDPKLGSNLQDANYDQANPQHQTTQGAMFNPKANEGAAQDSDRQKDVKLTDVVKNELAEK